MNPTDRLNRATEIAPVPSSRDADQADWIRHYTAQALSAHAAFRDIMEQPGPPLPQSGWTYLPLIGEASTAAAVSLASGSPDRTGTLWDLNPDCGALNGEWEEWLTGTLDRLGINPADIDGRYRAADFRSPSREATRA